MVAILDILKDVALQFWGTLSAMAPYLLFGFFVAGMLSVLVSPATVERHLGSRGMLSVLKAAVLGVPLPLCSCGVIPVAASLRRHGASRGATTSFLISTPQTGVDSIAVTYSILGPVFAVVRPIVSLVSGIVGGAFVEVLDEPDGAGSEAPMRCEGECCSPRASGSRLVRVFRYGFVNLPRDIGKALLLGILIAGVMSVFVEEDFLAKYLGGGSLARDLVAMLAMMVLGLPVYVCATASVPVASGLIHMGISPGAALVFLMTGPATNAAGVATIWKVMGRRTAAAYLAAVAVTALAAGLLLNYVITVAGPGAEHVAHGMLPGWVKSGCALVLLGVLGAATLGPLFRRARAPQLDGRGQVITLAVSGMTCSHCVENVRRALAGSAGVKEVEVSLKGGKAFVTGDGLDEAELRRKVEEIGYKVTGVGTAGPDED